VCVVESSVRFEETKLICLSEILVGSGVRGTLTVNRLNDHLSPVSHRYVAHQQLKQRVDLLDVYIPGRLVADIFTAHSFEDK
jgi:hypothetical protein